MNDVTPYWGADFWTFFMTLFQRLALLLTGHGSLATDELQMLVLSILGIAGAWIGTFMALKKTAMQVNAVSHTVLLGLLSVFLILRWVSPEFLVDDLLKNYSFLFLAGVISSAITMFFTDFCIEKLGINEDASIAFVFSTLFALGVIGTTLFTRNVHLSYEAITGNADAIHQYDLYLAAMALSLNIVLILSCYKGFVMLCFDQVFSRSSAGGKRVFNFLLLFLATMTMLLGFRVVGVILVLAMMIGPYLIIRPFVNRLFHLLLYGSVLSILLAVLSVALTRHFLSFYQLPLSTGAMMTSLYCISFVISLFFKRIHSERKGFDSTLES